jgi:hypothetical protein
MEERRDVIDREHVIRRRSPLTILDAHIGVPPETIRVIRVLAREGRPADEWLRGAHARYAELSGFQASELPRGW